MKPKSYLKLITPAVFVDKAVRTFKSTTLMRIILITLWITLLLRELLNTLFELHLWRGTKEVDEKIIEGLHHLSLMSGLSYPGLASLVSEKLWEMCFHFVGPKDVPMGKDGSRTVLINHLTTPLQSSRKGRRSRLASTKQDLPVRPGPAPWPAPFVSALVLEAMLEQHGDQNAELINKIVITLGGSPDQLGRYRTRLIKVQVPPPTFKRATSSQIPIIEWLAQSFSYYPSCWTEQPQCQYYYPADSPFFQGLPEQAVRALVVTGAVPVSKKV